MAETGFDLFARPQRRVYKVSEITRELKGLIEGRFASVIVEGEISNFRRNATSGHCYFTLKDEGAALRCALFRNQARLLPFVAGDGIAVVARGRLSVYEQGGEYNLVVDSLEPVGAGALALRFEELKKRLAAEGLFDPALKRPLPFLPTRIGVVTSPTGAAIQDFLRVLHHRWPNMPVVIAPARVQGDGAAAEVAEGIRRLAALRDVDVIVVTRGGGSLEDLWAFNEEVVARAIRRSPVPVVSAVGHETDFTISDFAADVRAATPTAAAELIVRSKRDVQEALDVATGRLRRAMHRQFEQRRARLGTLGKSLSDPRRLIGERRLVLDRLFQRAENKLRERLRAGRQRMRAAEEAMAKASPRARLAQQRDVLTRLEGRVVRAISSRVARDRSRLETLDGKLDGLSPLKVLSRGYALVYDDSGRLVRRSADVREGATVRTRVGEGSFRATVGEIDPPIDAIPTRE